jgi:nicotinamide-nucleotide amidase
MTAEIICVGTELLLGDVVNTNAAHIAKGLASIGVNLYYQLVVGDNPKRLRDAIHLAFARSDLIVMTGGLGPTYDDLTKETVAEYFGREMEMHEPSYKNLLEIFEKFNRGQNRKMTENNIKQAYMPKGAVVFQNQNGTAPGLAVTDGKKTAVLMPGPPREMMPMFDNQVMPYLARDSKKVLVSKNINIYGIGESAVEDMLHDYMLSMENPTIAPYAKTGEMYLRVTASADNVDRAEELLAPVVDKIQSLLGDYIYGIDAQNLETAVVINLKEKGLRVATAESCTGGWVSKLITNVDGSSEVFSCGICAYSNDIKEKILGVRAETLQKYGAVSAQTAAEMAAGVRRISGADIGISVTGIAGPKGGSKEKPVGLVYLGIASAHLTDTVKLTLSRGYQNERDYIRYNATLQALHSILRAAKSF